MFNAFLNEIAADSDKYFFNHGVAQSFYGVTLFKSNHNLIEENLLSLKGLANY
jgi:hypothetical protein